MLQSPSQVVVVGVTVHGSLSPHFPRGSHHRVENTLKDGPWCIVSGPACSEAGPTRLPLLLPLQPPATASPRRQWCHQEADLWGALCEFSRVNCRGSGGAACSPRRRDVCSGSLSVKALPLEPGGRAGLRS